MAQAAVGADFDQASNVAIDFSSKVSFNLEVSVQHFAELGDVGFGQISNLGPSVDTGFLKKLDYVVLADSVDQRQRVLRCFVSGKVDTCDTCHLVRSFSVSP